MAPFRTPETHPLRFLAWPRLPRRARKDTELHLFARISDFSVRWLAPPPKRANAESAYKSTNGDVRKTRPRFLPCSRLARSVTVTVELNTAKEASTGEDSTMSYPLRLTARYRPLTASRPMALSGPNSVADLRKPMSRSAPRSWKGGYRLLHHGFSREPPFPHPSVTCHDLESRGRKRENQRWTTKVEVKRSLELKRMIGGWLHEGGTIVSRFTKSD